MINQPTGAPGAQHHPLDRQRHRTRPLPEVAHQQNHTRSVPPQHVLPSSRWHTSCTVTHGAMAMGSKFDQRSCSYAEAIARIPAGKAIFIGSGAAEPVGSGRRAGASSRAIRRQSHRSSAHPWAGALRAPRARQQLPAPRLFHRTERARSCGRGASGLHAGLPVARSPSSSARGARRSTWR